MPITQIDLATGALRELTQDAVRPTANGSTIWLDIDQPTDADLNWLASQYHFHPLAIEDCRKFNQRSKVEPYEGYLFISVDAIAHRNGDLQALELETFLGPDYLITVHRDPIKALDEMRARSVSDSRTRKYHSDMLFYQIVDHMVDDIFPLLDEFEDAIDDLEDEILGNPTQESLHRVFDLKRQLVFLRKTVGPMRDAIDILADTRYEFIASATALYYRDTYDHLVRIYDLIETSRDLLGNSLDAYLSTVSNRLNEVMKRLTLLTTIFMPISFLVGFGGMNFTQWIPFDSQTAFAIMMALLVLVPIGMLIWFRRSKWV